MPTLYKIRGFTPTDSVITLYTHKLWHRRHFLNREVPYWLQSSITGSPFRGLLLILQKNSMFTDERHVTRYDWPMYSAIGRLIAGETYRVAAPLVRQSVRVIARYLSILMRLCLKPIIDRHVSQ